MVFKASLAAALILLAAQTVTPALASGMDSGGGMGGGIDPGDVQLGISLMFGGDEEPPPPPKKHAKSVTILLGAKPKTLTFSTPCHVWADAGRAAQKKEEWDKYTEAMNMYEACIAAK